MLFVSSVEASSRSLDALRVAPQALECVELARLGREDVEDDVRVVGEPGDRRAVTYAQLQREVSQAANALLELGIGIHPEFTALTVPARLREATCDHGW